jgi:hypothetical protein
LERLRFTQNVAKGAPVDADHCRRFAPLTTEADRPKIPMRGIPMPGALPRRTGRAGRLLATAMLVTLPLVATTACSDSEPEDQKIEQEED